MRRRCAGIVGRPAQHPLQHALFDRIEGSAARPRPPECDALVDNGAIDPDDVHLGGIFVHRIVHVPEHENAFEFRTTRKRA